MSLQHLVRTGVMGHVGPFRSVDATRFPRGARVVVRTGRGLEIGEVLAPPDHGLSEPDSGMILRRMTAEDELLVQRLEKNRHQAVEACQQHLDRRGVTETLVDVEHLFDGRSLFFYFLGDVTPKIEGITPELAEVYESRVKFREFAQLLTDGCGPNCGTEDAQGGCINCTSCSVAAACASQR